MEADEAAYIFSSKVVRNFTPVINNCHNINIFCFLQSTLVEKTIKSPMKNFFLTYDNAFNGRGLIRLGKDASVYRLS